MKGLIVMVCLGVVVAEPPAPYAPSGWRPSGPAFELPEREQQSQQYLPPVDPRNQGIPSTDYGTPDVSVQGLPTQEQQPIFKTSPIHGQPNQGPGFESDIKNLDQTLQQNQYQQQQETYRQFQRQKQLEASQARSKANNLPSPKAPRPFAHTTQAASTTAQTEKATEAPATQVTEANLNEREILEDEGQLAELKEKPSIEISKQNIQQYPGEFYLSSLAQLQLQPQFVPLQQLRNSYLAPIQAEKQVGYDGPAHFAALPSVLAQQQASPQLPQSPALLVGEQAPNPGFIAQQPLVQYQPPTSYQPLPQAQYQPVPQQAVQPEYLQPNPDAVAIQQPLQYQPQIAPLPQVQAQPVLLQPQPAPQQPKEVKDREEIETQGDNSNFQTQQVYQQPQQIYQQPQQVYQQPQQVYQQPQQVYQQPQQVYQQPQQVYQQSQQPQQVYQQPQQVYQQPEQVYQQPEQAYQQQQFYQQPILVQPANQYQAPQQLYPAPLTNQEGYPDQYQPQVIQGVQPQVIQGAQPQVFQGGQPQNFQGQDALQSGLDANQDGNDIDQSEEQESEEDEGTRSTAIATAFGARTQPRVFTQYGAPYPVPRVQAKPGFTTTESPVEDLTEDGPAIAQAVAVATRQKSAKLRRNRTRPVFTLDRSGHLVLAPGQ